jgi:hypothetical protein
MHIQSLNGESGHFPKDSTWSGLFVDEVEMWPVGVINPFGLGIP